MPFYLGFKNIFSFTVYLYVCIFWSSNKILFKNEQKHSYLSFTDNGNNKTKIKVNNTTIFQNAFKYEKKI